MRTKRIDLRKVDGEANPADLLTKHSASRHKLEYLVSLFGCRFIGGRAETAPQLRRSEGTQRALADKEHAVHANVANLEPREVKSESCEDYMLPHLESKARISTGTTEVS